MCSITHQYKPSMIFMAINFLRWLPFLLNQMNFKVCTVSSHVWSVPNFVLQMVIIPCVMKEIIETTRWRDVENNHSRAIIILEYEENEESSVSWRSYMHYYVLNSVMFWHIMFWCYWPAEMKTHCSIFVRHILSSVWSSIYVDFYNNYCCYKQYFYTW